MDIDKIISDYLSGELTEKDKKKLDDWLQENADHQDQFDSLQKIWKSPFGYPKIVNIDDERQKIWKRLNNDNTHPFPRQKETSSITKVILRYAAVIILLMTVSYIVWDNTNAHNENLQAKVEMIDRNNPLGQKSKIQLPDGSTVWLNAGSKLSYPSQFNNGTRRLHLEGEAYFEVVKNPNIPFEVFTKGLVVTVLGTSFNVNAFGNKHVETIALNTGKVKIECLDTMNNKCSTSFLNPGEQALFNNQTGSINISTYNGTDPYAWKDGKIVFNHASFEEVLEILTRWYNVEFEVAGVPKHTWDYTSTFENESLENILESLKFSEKIEYQMKGSKIEINL